MPYNAAFRVFWSIENTLTLMSDTSEPPATRANVALTGSPHARIHCRRSYKRSQRRGRRRRSRSRHCSRPNVAGGTTPRPLPASSVGDAPPPTEGRRTDTRACHIYLKKTEATEEVALPGAKTATVVRLRCCRMLQVPAWGVACVETRATAVQTRRKGTPAIVRAPALGCI